MPESSKPSGISEIQLVTASEMPDGLELSVGYHARTYHIPTLFLLPLYYYHLNLTSSSSVPLTSHRVSFHVVN